jgi:hypothetical protein
MVYVVMIACGLLASPPGSGRAAGGQREEQREGQREGQRGGSGGWERGVEVDAGVVAGEMAGIRTCVRASGGGPVRVVNRRRTPRGPGNWHAEMGKLPRQAEYHSAAGCQPNAT